MTNQEIVRKVFEAIRSDPTLLAEIETQINKRRFVLFRVLDRLTMPFYLVMGFWILPKLIKAVFRWTGTR